MVDIERIVQKLVNKAITESSERGLGLNIKEQDRNKTGTVVI